MRSSVGALDAGTGGDSGTGPDAGTLTNNGLKCAPDYTCYAVPGSDLVWAMKNDGNVNGPDCTDVCMNALSQICAYYALRRARSGRRRGRDVCGCNRCLRE